MTLDRTSTVVVLAVEGLPQRHCWPSVPDYGTSDYATTLVVVPTGSGSQWDVIEQSSSVGSWRWSAAEETRWYRVHPQPLAASTDDDTATDLAVVLDRDASVPGIVNGQKLIWDRETVQVDGAPSGANIQLLRAQLGSVAAAHRKGSLFWSIDDPPALTGRLVQVFLVPKTGGSTASESAANRILRGRIGSEPRSGDADAAEIEVIERGTVDLEVNRDPVLRRLAKWTETDDAFVSREDEDGILYGYTPTYHASGGYIYTPEEGPRGRVRAMRVNDPTGFGTDQSEIGIVWPPGEVAVPGFYDAYEVVWSDASESFPTFGSIAGSTFVPSSNPAIMCLNLLLSKPGTAGTNGVYDRGDYLAEFSLQLDTDLVDVTLWERLAARTAHVRADSLWLGGPKAHKIGEILRSLCLMVGVTVATTRDGVWRPIALTSVYPGDDSATVQAAAAEHSHTIQGRPIAGVEVQCDLGPDGEATRKLLIDDGTGADYYPRDHGQIETWERMPYRRDHLVTLNREILALLGGRFRRLALRLMAYQFTLGPTDGNGREIGDGLTITSPRVRNPVTGALSGTATGRVLRVDTRLREGIVNLEVALLDDSGKIARYCPSAKVIGYNSATLRIHTAGHKYARTGEWAARQFDVGDAVGCYESDGTPRSDIAGTHDDVYVTAVGNRYIEISQAFEDAGGSDLKPVPGDLISYAYYARAKSDGPATQLDEHAWQASGNLGAEVLAGDDPYVRGD